LVSVPEVRRVISPTFFFLFSQLGVGMMLCLFFISPREIGNSFFKFASLTSAILMGVVLGFDFMFPSPVRAGGLPVMLLFISALLTVVYNRVMDAKKYTAGLWLLIALSATGLLSIITDSTAFNSNKFNLLMQLGGWEYILLVLGNLAATAILGSVMLTMVFGHWYLVIPGLSITHLARLTKVLIAAVVFRIATIALSFAVVDLKQAIPMGRIMRELMLGQGLFFWPRVLFGVVIPIVLSVMIWNTVKLKHTQAATGLLYLAVVAVLFGEFFSKFLLFTSRLAL